MRRGCMAAQASLKELWLAGKDGGLSAREQLKAWALREAWKEHNDSEYGMHTWIAERLTNPSCQRRRRGHFVDPGPKVPGLEVPAPSFPEGEEPPTRPAPTTLPSPNPTLSTLSGRGERCFAFSKL